MTIKNTKPKCEEPTTPKLSWIQIDSDAYVDASKFTALRIVGDRLKCYRFNQITEYQCSPEIARASLNRLYSPGVKIENRIVNEVMKKLEKQSAFGSFVAENPLLPKR